MPVDMREVKFRALDYMLAGIVIAACVIASSALLGLAVGVFMRAFRWGAGY